VNAGRHTVHVERLEGHGVKVWLDGMQIKALKSWSIVEELRPPSVLSFTISTDQVIWGAPEADPIAPPAPAPVVDDGLDHYVDTRLGGRTTPSGRRACEACGETWMCSTAQRRWDATGTTLLPRDTPVVSAAEADALRRLDEVRRLVNQYTASGLLTVAHGNRLLQILDQPEVDKSSDTPLG
jgi:hypothetical protein